MSNEKLTAPATDRFSPRRAFLFASPFLLMGAVALLLMVYGVLTRQLNVRAAKHLLTMLVVCAGLSMVIIGWFAGKRPKPSVQLKASHPDQPWRWRADWVNNRADNSVRPAIFFLWVFVLFFTVISLVAVWMVWRQARFGSPAAWLGLIFPVIGVAVVGFAARTTLAWRRFGRASLSATALPARPGGVLAGELHVPAGLRPEHAFYLRLSCLRRTTAPRGKQRITTERILWQDEKWLRPNLPQPRAGATRLPVFFQLPAGLPDSTVEGRDGVQWRLEASAKVSGPDFHGTFEVPVFKPADAQPAALADGATPAPAAPVPTAAPDPTLAWQLTLDEVRKEIRSRIQVTDKPGGREILFPSGRAPGFTAGAAAIWLIWTVTVILMVRWHAPILFPVVFAAVDVLMSLFLLDLWLRCNLVLVTPTQLKIQTAWLSYQKETVLAVADVASLKADIGATAGHAAYYDLKIRTRDGREFIAAKFLNHKPEADWLIRQIAAALKRP